MPDTHAALETLSRFAEAKRQASLTGSLLGLDLPARDRVLQLEFAKFEPALAAALTAAAERGEPVPIDGAGISLTDGGDTWYAHPDGRLTREYTRYPGFAAFAEQLADRPPVDFSQGVAREGVLDACYHAFWSPSATNWQPTRVFELDGHDRERFCALAGWPAPAADLPVLVLLRRDHYESLLGDALESFGAAVTAREESIDAGIFAQTLAMSALAQGLTVQELEFEGEALEKARAWLEEALTRRLARLEGAAEGPAARTHEALAAVAAGLARGQYIPDALVVVGRPAGGSVAPYPAFDRVVREHSTQRVASPSAELGHAEMAAYWAAARGSLPAPDRELVQFADFSWHDRVPSRIGKAMFEALYGVGADPATMSGGEGGLLTEMTLKNFIGHARRTVPDHPAHALPAGWEEMEDAELRRAAKSIPLRAADAGRYMRERILRDGKYRVEGGIVVDDAGRPLPLPLYVRMLKALASTFGHFFLKFQNTHPQNAVLLADPRRGHHAYRALGKAASVLTYMARAEGASAIIKTGPIDLAREPIGRILAENPDDSPRLGPWREALASGALTPAMTFQVGWPLAGTDVIDPGTPGEHTGLEERRRDKRPPREDFCRHVFPAR